MRRYIFIILACVVFALPIHLKAQNNRVNCPCGSGHTCTTDGGLVTAVCGIQATITTPCTSGVLYSYGSRPLTTFKGFPEPCMDVYYNTADGPHNHNVTFVEAPQGGNASAKNMDQCAGFSAANGSQPAAFWGLIDGSAFAGTVAAGTHLNAVCVQLGLQVVAKLNADYAAGVTSIQVAGLSGGSHYWPQGPGYTMCIDTFNQECIPVTAQTNCSPPYTSNCVYDVTLASPTKYAHNHIIEGISAIYVWGVDSNRFGTPAYPNALMFGTCDTVRLFSYLNGVIGNKQYIAWGVSGTTITMENAIAYGKTLEGLAAPQGCGFASPDTSWQVIGTYLVSPPPDFGALTVYGLIPSTAGNPCVTTKQGDKPDPGTGHSFGAWIGTLNNGIGYVSSISSTEYSNGSLVVKNPNALTQAAKNIGLQGCFPGTVNNCYYKTNSDGYLGSIFVAEGEKEGGCPGAAALAFTSPVASPQGPPDTFPVDADLIGNTYHFQRNAGHGAKMNVGPGCTEGGMCATSVVFTDMVKWMAPILAHQHGNVSNAGISGAGAH